MIEIRELTCEIEFVDIDVNNYKTLNPLDVLEIGKQIRVTIAMTDMPACWAFEDITRFRIMCVYPQLIAWMVLASLIVVVSQDGRQRIL